MSSQTPRRGLASFLYVGSRDLSSAAIRALPTRLFPQRPSSGSVAQIACRWVDVGQEAADVLGQFGSVGMPVSVTPDGEPVRRGVRGPGEVVGAGRAGTSGDHEL